MATNSTLPPPLISDDHCTQSQPTTAVIDPPPPDYITSISQLRTLATALSTFQRRYDELQQHLDFIQTTIDSKLPDPSIIPPLIHTQTTTPPLKSSISITPSSIPDKNPRKSPNLKISDIQPNIKNVTDIPSAIASTFSEKAEPKPDAKLPDLESKCDRDLAKIGQNTDNGATVDPTKSELERLCSTMMCGRSLRRYIVTHLSDIKKLREEVPKALKLSTNPAKLVLECFGKFYLQGIRAYTRDSPMVSGREASILSLEFFLLMESDKVVVENEVKEEAHNAAVAWQKRLTSEGGLYNACETDARGLLLLIGCYGIPDVFKIEDIKDLIRSSNIKEISGALRRSHHLLAKIPEIIERMLKYNREVEAVNIVYTFDVQDRYPPQTILKSFMSKSDEISKRKRTEAEDLSAVLNKDKKHLYDLKSLLKCWETHKIDPSKSFPDLALNEKISSLEREITVFDKKVREDMTNKRKEKEVEYSKRSKTQDARRSRFPGHEPPLQKYGYSASPSVPYESGVGDIHATRILHEYPAVPMDVPRGSVAGAGLLHEYGASTRVGGGGGLVAADIEGGFLSRDLYAASHLGMHVNMDPYNGQLHRWHGDVASDERFVSQTYARKPLYSGYDGLHRPSPALEGFAGMPNRPAAGSSIPSSASDLYHFADSVLESELQHKGASFSGANLRPGKPSNHKSSYL